ncbi:MFS transporter [Pseudorhizobium endolithicum]|jgi:DHA1 family bicyclomycin/chloramphenicol resistance-like MFS transporter|uniref:MFS transporter n=1 Tax=Pseudorhizobium endolithicum TaxID=1191678 RepID=A0ABM8PWS4_9HYPH|nr:multidrug effflux MFS transporter [Pseudorhizobium endolithicum]CAD7052667.1 MFS transporter [Pseudorhizobium endolithicum]
MTPSVTREHIVLYALLTSLTAVSIDALLPGLRQIASELAPAPPLSTQHVVSLFILGMVFGELFIGPLSDAIGRKRALVIGIGLYTVGTLVALFASSLEEVVAGRMLQGAGAAGPKIATRAMIRDQFEGEAMARIMSLLFSLFILVPMVAPVLGQGVIAFAGWRAVFAVYLVLALVMGTWLVLRQTETLPPERRIPFRPRVLLANASRILANRRVALLMAATGFVFGAQLLYLSIAADLFADLYKVHETFPLYFALLAGGIGLASYLNSRLVGRVGMDAMARFGFLGLTFAGLLMLTASIACDGRPPLMLLLLFGFAAFFAIGILFGNLNAIAMRSLGQVAGLGASMIASGSSLVASLFAVGLGPLYDGTTNVLAGGIVLAGATSLFLAELAARISDAPIAVAR